jgi:hypothetical protein
MLAEYKRYTEKNLMVTFEDLCLCDLKVRDFMGYLVVIILGDFSLFWEK